jgi:protein-disulfide isomerase
MRPPRITIRLVKRGLAPVLICAAALSLAHPVFAGNDLQKQVTALQAQVTALQQQQQQILDSIDQLKKQIASLPAAPGQPPQPTLPTSIDVAGLPVEGDSGAKVAIVEFTDFQCPFCGRYATQTYPQILANYINTGKIKYFYEDFPLPMHPNAAPAANAAHCAAEQGKFWEMHDSLFANQNALGQSDFSGRAQTLGLNVTQFNACVTASKYGDAVQKSMTLGNSLGITGTPTFYIGTIRDDGSVAPDKQIMGAQPYDQFKAALDAEFAPKA